MSARVMLFAMVAGTALVVFAAARHDDEPTPEPPARPHESPWLSRAAAAQIFGDGGSPGPLFAGVELGGPPPSPEVRARVAEFARANGVEIDFDVTGDVLAAVRFAVTFSGCCGYEGADVLALRLGRPTSGGGCTSEPKWVDDWAATSDAGVHMRARIRVNRIAVRWERAPTLSGLLDRAEDLIGGEATAIGEAAGDRWHELDPNQQYLLEMPYPFVPTGFEILESLRDRDDLGFRLFVERGRIVEVSFPLRRFSYEAADEAAKEAAATLRSRWGKPRVSESTQTFRKPDRIITVDVDPFPTKITIRSARYRGQRTE